MAGALALAGCTLLAPSVADIVGGGSAGNVDASADQSSNPSDGAQDGKLDPGPDANVDAQTDAFPPSHVEQLSAGYDHACARLDDDTLWCWGANSDGQLGLGDRKDRATPTQVVLDPIAEVAAVGTHTCVRFKKDNSVTCWGDPASGQLGLPSTGEVIAPGPARVAFGNKTAVSLVGGGTTTCARLSDGTAACWGANTFGELGVTDAPSHGTPVPVPLPTPIVDLAVGFQFTCGRSKDAQYQCWGRNDHGQLGRGGKSAQEAPYPVNLPLSASVESMSLGSTHGCLVLTGGKLKCWGFNVRGALGIGPDGLDHPSPVDVTFSNGEQIASASLGQLGSCALLSSGAVRCWGDNSSGQRGDGAATNTLVTEPTSQVTLDQRAVELAVGTKHACARMQDRSVRCWGDNRVGQSGTGVAGYVPVPTPVPLPANAGALLGLAAGGSHTCFRFAQGWSCTGDNTFGQLGLGDLISRSKVPSQTVAGFDRLAGGATFACGLNTGAGQITCWGDNSLGQLGLGPGPFKNAPASPVPLAQQVGDFSLGASHACVRSGGAIRCWGGNAAGQLGDGTTVDRSVPSTAALPSSLSITTGGQHSCAILPDKTVQCWGLNDNGQLGAGDRTSRNAPDVVLTFAAGAAQLALGARHTCVRLTNGTAVRCWGAQEAVGQVFTADKLSPPLQNVGLPQVAIDIVASDRTTCARLSDKTVLCWGRNNAGQLAQGPGDRADRVTPVVVPLAGPAEEIVGGAEHFCARLSDGTAQCWGNGSAGQLGLGDALINHASPVRAVGL